MNATAKQGLVQVETGNGCGDIFRDAEGRAYWSDGSRITDRDLQLSDAPDVLAEVLRDHKLTVLAADADGNEVEDSL